MFGELATADASLYRAARCTGVGIAAGERRARDDASRGMARATVRAYEWYGIFRGTGRDICHGNAIVTFTGWLADWLAADAGACCRTALVHSVRPLVPSFLRSFGLSLGEAIARTKYSWR